MIPTDWSLDDLEREYILSITLTNNSCKKLEKDTVGHSESKLWFFSVARKINASNAHKVFIRKKKIETLVPSFLEDELLADESFYKRTLVPRKRREELHLKKQI